MPWSLTASTMWVPSSPRSPTATAPCLPSATSSAQMTSRTVHGTRHTTELSEFTSPRQRVVVCHYHMYFNLYTLNTLIDPAYPCVLCFSRGQSLYFQGCHSSGFRFCLFSARCQTCFGNNYLGMTIRMWQTTCSTRPTSGEWLALPIFS